MQYIRLLSVHLMHLSIFIVITFAVPHHFCVSYTLPSFQTSSPSTWVLAARPTNWTVDPEIGYYRIGPIRFCVDRSNSLVGRLIVTVLAYGWQTNHERVMVRVNQHTIVIARTHQVIALTVLVKRSQKCRGLCCCTGEIATPPIQ